MALPRCANDAMILPCLDGRRCVWHRMLAARRVRLVPCDPRVQETIATKR
jgi:hypothetical protein